MSRPLYIKFGCLRGELLGRAPRIVISTIASANHLPNLGILTPSRLMRLSPLVHDLAACYSCFECPRSSADRALASGARGVGSSPAGGTSRCALALPPKGTYVRFGFRQCPSLRPVTLLVCPTVWLIGQSAEAEIGAQPSKLLLVGAVPLQRADIFGQRHIQAQRRQPFV